MSLKNNAALYPQPLTLARQAEIILAFVKVLYINGQTTKQIIAEAEKMARMLKKNIMLDVQWGKLWLHLSDDHGGQAVQVVAAEPVNVHMGKVVATMDVLSAFFTGKTDLTQAYTILLRIDHQPPAPTWLFALAAAVGSVALALIFGLQEAAAAAVIFGSAAIGGVVRRYLASISSNLFLQPLVAATIAGIIGAIAVHAHLNSALRLVALCPCMVLVPGPHFLNSSLDLMHGRLQLGMARLLLAVLVCISISLGVLAGMAMLHVNLPIEPMAQHQIPLWQDMIAAAIAIVAYNIFFSIPLRFIVWPVIVGALGHMLRWLALVHFAAQVATASFVACLFVGLVLTLVAHYQRLPFAALAFAAVVSMIPGVYLFRMMSGIIALTAEPILSYTVLSQTIYVGLNALSITAAISLGLLIPKLLLDKPLKAALPW